MRKLHLLLLPALLLAFALGLAACGGGGESDEDKITTTIEDAATSTDPAVCGETQTLAFMEQTTGGSGKKAEKECEQEAENNANQPEAVAVSKVAVNGEKATADTAFKGGSLDGQTVEIALVEEDGEWKVDELAGFAKFDPAGLVKVFSEQLEEEPNLEPETAKCIIEGIEELPDSALEGIVIENNNEPVVEVAESCE